MKELIKSAYEVGTEMTPAMSLIKDIILWGDKKFTERRNKVLLEFYKALLDGDVSQERIEYEKKNIQANEDQFYILLNLALNEEELEKTFVYANIYKYIVNNHKLEKHLKIFLLKAAKDIPFSAIELLPKIYIHQKYHTKLKNLNDYLKGLHTSNGYETSILKNYNLINSGQAAFGPIQYTICKEYFTLVMNAFFYKENIIPEKYKVKIWEEKRALILCNDKTSSYLIDKITSILNKYSIYYEMGNLETAKTDLFSHYISAITDLEDDKFNVSDLKSNSKLLKVTCTNIIGRNDILYLDKKEHLEKFEYTLNRFSD